MNEKPPCGVGALYYERPENARKPQAKEPDAVRRAPEATRSETAQSSDSVVFAFLPYTPAISRATAYTAELNAPPKSRMMMSTSAIPEKGDASSWERHFR